MNKNGPRKWGSWGEKSTQLPLTLEGEKCTSSDISEAGHRDSTILGGEDAMRFLKMTVPERVEQLKRTIDQATEVELEEMAAEYELDVRTFIGPVQRAREVRLRLGEALFRHSLVVKKLGSRDWTRWVENTLRMPRQTAYDYITEWKKANGIAVESYEESARPSPEVGVVAADGPSDATGRGTGSSTGENPSWNPGDDVTTVSPPLHSTAEDREFYREFRKRNGGRVYRMFHATFTEIVAIAKEEARVREEKTSEEAGEATAPTAEILAI